MAFTKLSSACGFKHADDFRLLMCATWLRRQQSKERFIRAFTLAKSRLTLLEKKKVYANVKLNFRNKSKLNLQQLRIYSVKWPHFDIINKVLH